MPSGATRGPISVTTATGTAVSASSFTPTAASAPEGLFVSPTGSDATGDGSISKPFATLEKAQATMRLGGPQIAYIRAGYYALPVVIQGGVSYGLYLTAADSGQTWSYYPPDGYNSAILDGGSTSPSAGIQELITLDGASHVTINGLQLQHFRWVGIGLHGGWSHYQLFPTHPSTADGNAIANNVIHDGGYDTTPIFGYGGGAIYGVGWIPNTTVRNNAIYNIVSFGIVVSGGDMSGDIDSAQISNNAVISTCKVVADCGSIYVQDTGASSRHIRISDNFVRDSGLRGAGARSIYLDDGVSGAIVSGNVSSGVFSFAFSIHGGSDNKILSNIVDMGRATNRGILLYQGDGITGMSGNSVERNVIVSGGAGSRYQGSSFGAQPTIRNNAYHQYGSGAAIHAEGLNGLNGDASPILVNPRLSCWMYVVSNDSPVLSPPVSFVPITRGWGPPGYTLPKTGTPPSQPHSC